MSDIENYWQRARARRYPRRAVLCGGVAGLAAIAGSALLGCAATKKPAASSAGAPAGQNQTPQSGGVFNTYNTANLGPLDPQGGAGQSSQIATATIYGGLFRFKSGADPQIALNQEPENNLAASIESPDGLTWTVKLRPDVHFHDIPPVSGRLVQAEDVKASFQRAYRVANNTNRSLITMIDPNQIETPATDTVVFKLRDVFGAFHSTLAGNGTDILPHEALAGSYDPQKVMIGTGAFTLDSYSPDVAIVLKKNPHWFEQGRPYVDSIHASIIPDPSQQLAQFSVGHLDEFHPSPNDLGTAKANNPKAMVLGVPSDHSWAFFGHMDHPSSPFHDIKVRQALSMAIDRPTLGKAIYANQYSNNGVIPAVLGKWALPPDQLGDASQYYKYNLDAAKKLIQDTPAAKQIRRFLYPSVFYGPQFDTLCQTVSSMLNAAGFQIQLVAIDYNKDFLGGGKGALYGNYPDDALLASREGIHNNAETTLAYNYQTGNDHNLPKVSDPQLDQMLAKMASTLDDNARLQIVQQIQRYAASQVYLIPLPSEFAYTLVQPWVHNYNYSPVEGSGTFSKFWLKR